MSKISVGLNVIKKPSLSSRPPPAKRKPIFDNDDSEAEDDRPTFKSAENIESITSLDSDSVHPPLKTQTTKPSAPLSKSKLHGPPNHPPKRTLNQPPQTTENISSKYSSTKHAQEAESLDPSIYDYDGIYDAMKAPPPNSTTEADALGTKPKYMTALKAAAEVRKRDQIRAQDRKTAREREAEGDEFKDKESFVTGAYKRQQEELRRLEEEEKAKDAKEEEERRKGGAGGGMKVFYKGLLERDEERHQAALRAVEESKKGKKGVEESEKVEGGEGVLPEGKKEKSEAEIAREKGATINEDGEVVDKRELLNAGLNAGSAAKVKKPITAKPSGVTGRKGETQRERETREFEEQLLGKHGLSSSDDDDEEEDHGGDARASKSRKMEGELLRGLGSP